MPDSGIDDSFLNHLKGGARGCNVLADEAAPEHRIQPGENLGRIVCVFPLRGEARFH
jgi:hypothetical protein